MTLRPRWCPALWIALATLATAATADPAAPAKHSTLALPMRDRPAPDAHPDVPMCIDTNGNYVACSTLAPVTYYHHRIVSNPKVWVIFWTSAVNSTTQQQIGGFYSAVTNSVLFDWMVEYNTDFANADGTNQQLGRGVYAGAYTITPTTTSSTSVSDGDIQAELTAQMNNGQIPQPDDNSIFMVYFPAGYTITQSGGGASCVKFCAYHDTFLYGSQDTFYGVFPDLASGGCNGVCGGQATVFQNLCSASTHELVETTTDAEVGLYDLFHLEYSYAWDSEASGGKAAGNEVGDMCNQFTSTINSVADGTTYTIQQIFSQNTDQCQTEYEFVNDYRFYMNPTTIVVSPGATAAVPVTSELTAGNPPAHPITISGSLSGVTVALDKTTLEPNDSTYLRFSVTADAPVSTPTQYVLNASDPTLYVTSRTASILLWVEPAPTNLSLTGVTNGGEAHGTVSLQGSASPSASGSLYFVGLYIDGTLVSNGTSSTTYSWNTSSLVPGSQHTVILYAEDYDGGNAQITDTVTIQGTPTVEIVSPSSGTVTGLVSLVANGAAPAGTSIAHLAISVDGTSVASGSSAPVTGSWNSALAANGTHTVTASITDVDGTSATATPVTITVANLPTVTISPATTTVSGTVALSVTAAPVHGGTLSSIALSIDGTAVVTGATSPLTYNWDTSMLAQGSTHVLLAQVTDADHATASDTETVTVRAGPVVTLSAPAGTGSTGALSGTVTIEASATPAAGTTLASLAISVNGTQLGTGAAATLTESWNTKLVANGAHVISAVAADADLGSTSKSVTVMVNNGEPGVNGFTLSIDPATAELISGGEPVAFTLSTAFTGSAESITLSVVGLPPGVTSSFSSATVTAGASATLTLTAPAGTATASSTLFSVGGTSPSVPNGVSVTATVSVAESAASGCSTGGGWELAAFFGLAGLWPLARRRRAAIV